MGWLFGKKAEKPAAPEKESEDRDIFSTHFKMSGKSHTLARLKAILNMAPQPTAEDGAMDAADSTFKQLANIPYSISSKLADWYTSHGFIGYQLCAVMAQQWLIDRACSLPARDATRNGYDIVTTSGEKLETGALKVLQAYDKKFRARWNLEQFIRMGRIFGVRVAFFEVESTDAQYYEKPFNPDGITPGSYKGIVQVDPYWCTPELVGSSVAQPGSMHFYDPTFWRVGGRKIHRSHLCVYRHKEPPDLLKPMYMYGGIPVPQMIMERVYAAERCANEMPLLALSKRLRVWLTDRAEFIARGDDAVNGMMDMISFADNHGVLVGDKEKEEFDQKDTSLGELDNVVMTGFQLVAAAAGVPATKLLGTSPKGFNTTGEYETKSYHEELESIQEHDLSALIERHHLMVMRSYVPKEDWSETSVTWRPVDSPTASELAERNLKKAQTGQALVQSQAILPEDERRRVATDPDSGYHQLGDDADGAQLLRDAGIEEDVIEAALEAGINGEAQPD